MKIDGGCHCGYITYEAEADPAHTAICHCTDCQTLSGSAFGAVAICVGIWGDAISGISRVPGQAARSIG